MSATRSTSSARPGACSAPAAPAGPRRGGVAAGRAPQRVDPGPAMSAPDSRPRVLLVRGHQTNSWHLRPWRHLLDEYDVAALRTGSNWFDTDLMGVPAQPVRTIRDVLPAGRIG